MCEITPNVSRPIISLGSKFGTFYELAKKIAEYEESNFMKLYIKDSRTIKGLEKRCPNKAKILKTDLKYSNIHYCCIHGGRDFKPRGRGIKNSRTFLKGCNMEIGVSTSDCGQYLIVKKMREIHNHEIDKLAYINLPHKRKLDKDTKEEVLKLLKMKANKKMVQQHIKDQTGKGVLLRDLSNLKARDVQKQGDIRKDFLKLFNFLNSKQGSTTEIISDTEDNLPGIYYQSQRMRIVFSAYPEILVIDATHKLNDSKMPLYVLLAEDGNGQSEIVCLFLMAKEDNTCISKFASIFKYHNPEWAKIVSIITDKSFNERAIFGCEFPQAKLLTCFFHPLKIFRREISCERLGISVTERHKVLEIINEIVHAKNEESYFELRSKLHEMKIPSVTQYFEDFWHVSRDEWVGVLKSSTAMCLTSRTNNRIESINQKIKDVCSRFSGIDQCFQELLIVTNSLATERDHRSSEMITKRSTVSYAPDSTLGKYANLLTPYGFSHLQYQFELKDSVDLHERISENECEVETLNGRIIVTTEKCQCSFYTGMIMPCSHIFAFREVLGLPLCDISLLHKRWTISHFKQNQLEELTSNIYGSDIAEETIIEVPKPGSSNSKYRQAFSVCQSLATILSKMPTTKFQESLKQLKTIKESWQNNDNIIMEPMYLQNEEGIFGVHIIPD